MTLVQQLGVVKVEGVGRHHATRGLGVRGRWATAITRRVKGLES